MRDYANESDISLICAAQAGDQAAAEAMCVRHEPLVRYVARRFMGRGREMEDLYQLGRLGLHKAVRNFSAEYSVKFSTYAVPLIMGEIRRFLRDDGQIHISRSIRENSAKVARLIEEYGEEMPVSERRSFFEIHSSMKMPLFLSGDGISIPEQCFMVKR